MKNLFLTVAFVGLGGAAAAQDWSGFYLGVQSANSDYTNSYLNNGIPDNVPVDGGGSLTGVFAGYNHQLGNFVLGGELSYLSGDPAYDQFSDYFFSDMLDLKARAGYSLGRVLPYAVIGYSQTEWTNGTLTPVDADGFAYGIGAEFRATDQIVVGLEYLKRDLTADDFVESPGSNMESDFSTIAVRVAYSF
jgi:outer membrane immunogenic protein